MARSVRRGPIRASNALGPEAGPPTIEKVTIGKRVRLIAEAARKKVRILCLQGLFDGPCLRAEPEARWRRPTERAPDGPTVAPISR